MTTYGDLLGQWMLDEFSGVGLWALVPMFLGVLVLTAGLVILVRSVKTGTDAV